MRVSRIFFLLPPFALMVCGAPSADGPASAPATAATTDAVEFKAPDGTYSFRYPAGWTAEAANGGTLLLAPVEEGGWQANVYFELGSDPEGRTMAQALSDYSAGLQTTKTDFQLIGMDTIDTAGSSAGRITYTHTSSGTQLLSWELIVPPPAGNNRLFITAATASSLKEKYLPVFDAVVKSVSFNG